jgi:uncharacterized protein YbbC (DUF1343 family)
MMALPMDRSPRIRVGLERVAESPFSKLAGARVGLVMNQASVDSRFRYAFDVLQSDSRVKLTKLFSPQHGLWGEEQANMIETPHGRSPLPGGVPLFSLYSETRRPSREMLDGLDAFVIDLQDVGTRIYTYIWTVSHCLEACVERGLPVVILDRPNPLGRTIVEGPVLDPEYASFVGRAPIPMRHGCTIGELAAHLNISMGIGAALTVIPCDGLSPGPMWPEMGRTWLPPSPNLPAFESVLVYPGQVLLEGTNLSEGRGTTTPFEIAGAPWIEPFRLAAMLNERQLPGVVFRPLKFRPTFDKWKGESCGGVAFHVTDRESFRSYSATLHLLAAMKTLWPRDFNWLPPPYEYETVKMPIDILSGSSALRDWVASELPGLSPPADVLGNANAERWLQRMRATAVQDR